MSFDTHTFLKSAKAHSGTALIALIVSTATGSVVPMLQQWHADKQTGESAHILWQHIQEQDKEIADLKSELRYMEGRLRIPQQQEKP